MAADATLDRLAEQIAWYDRRSMYCQRCFKGLKTGVILAAAVVPFSAGMGAPSFWTGGLGVLIVLFEGLQQLNQYHDHWIGFRSTCEALKHEKHLYQAQAGPYAAAQNSHALLAERIESLISQEHAKWVSTAEQAGRKAVTQHR